MGLRTTGVEFKNNVKRAWWKKFVQQCPYNVGLDSAILMNPQTWVASGHVGGFSDPLMDCKDCKTRHRADKLIEDQTGTATGGWSDAQRWVSFRKRESPARAAVPRTLPIFANSI
jgi:glycyl-tRNA synthetase